MRDPVLFIIEIGISLLISLSLILLITRSLKSALLESCPTESQANFWLTYTHIMFLIAPLLLVLLMDEINGIQNTDDLQAIVIAAISGLLVGMIILGKKMYIPVAQNTNKENQK